MTTVDLAPGTRLHPLDDAGRPRWHVAMTDVDGTEEVPVVDACEEPTPAVRTTHGRYLVGQARRYVVVRFMDGEEYAVEWPEPGARA
jgi:hypothetical protein